MVCQVGILKFPSFVFAPSFGKYKYAKNKKKKEKKSAVIFLFRKQITTTKHQQTKNKRVVTIILLFNTNVKGDFLVTCTHIFQED